MDNNLNWKTCLRVPAGVGPEDVVRATAVSLNYPYIIQPPDTAIYRLEADPATNTIKRVKTDAAYDPTRGDFVVWVIAKGRTLLLANGQPIGFLFEGEAKAAALAHGGEAVTQADFHARMQSLIITPDNPTGGGIILPFDTK